MNNTILYTIYREIYRSFSDNIVVPRTRKPRPDVRRIQRIIIAIVIIGIVIIAIVMIAIVMIAIGDSYLPFCEIYVYRLPGIPCI